MLRNERSDATTPPASALALPDENHWALHAADLIDVPDDAPPSWTPLPYQTPPDFDEGDWLYWFLSGGRGIGKTDTGAYAFDRYMVSHPKSRGRIIAPTLGDAREACVFGVSGLKAHNPEVRFLWSEGAVYWPNGARARIFGAHGPDDVERLRAGGNSEIDWYEEMAAWVKLDEAFDQARFGLRSTRRDHVRTIITSTPKPRPLIRRLLSDPRSIVVRASTADNPHLSSQVRSDLELRYGGTRLGRQELGGELLEDVPGALWSLARLDELRVSVAPEMARIVVGVDPAATSNEESDETGIIVAGRGMDAHGYTLADLSGKYSPDGWGKRVVQAYVDWNADCVVAEANNGGEMVEAVIRRAAMDMGVMLKVKLVHASRGKRTRAEPVAQLSEQGREHHVGQSFAKLEDQLCTWVQGEDSPDRLDAKVWALTECMPVAGHGAAWLTVWADAAAESGEAAALKALGPSHRTGVIQMPTGRIPAQ